MDRNTPPCKTSFLKGKWVAFFVFSIESVVVQMNQTFVKQGDKLPIGIDSFRRLVTHNCTFVDKTLLIHEFIGSPDIVSLILRPRRFGKSMNLNMLK